MRKYALVNNNIITDIQTLDEEQLRLIIKSNEMVVDIEDITPQPSLRWILNGNNFEIPQGNTDREAFEIDLNNRKSEFGTALAKDAVNRIGARNKILNKSGTQVTALLTTLIGVKSLMETGALGTARSSCIHLKTVYTEYSDIFDRIVSEINRFELNFGL